MHMLDDPIPHNALTSWPRGRSDLVVRTTARDNEGHGQSDMEEKDDETDAEDEGDEEVEDQRNEGPISADLIAGRFA